MTDAERVEKIRERSIIDPLRFDVSRNEAMFLLAHIDALTKRAQEAEIELGAWHKAFGTQQLTHALAQRDAVVRAAEPLIKNLHLLKHRPNDMPINEGCNLKIGLFRTLAQEVEKARE